MKISTEISSASKIVGEEKAVEMIAKAGFDAWDFSMFEMARYDWNTHLLKQNNHPLTGDNPLAFARKLKQIGLDNGIFCNQSHAPFPTGVKPVFDTLKRAIECSAEAGAKTCIIHPACSKSVEKDAEMYWELLPFAKEAGVKIAAENMYDWDKTEDHAMLSSCSTAETTLELFKKVNSDWLTYCLDIGHAEMYGLHTSAVEMIEKLGNKVTALHIHDNDQKHDSHEIPFSMNIPFEKVVTALKKANYSGEFTLESDAYLKNHGYTQENVFEGIKIMADTARKLAEMFEKA